MILPHLSGGPLLQERKCDYLIGSWMRERPKERKEEEAVRCQLGSSSMVQVDLTVGSGRGKACQTPRSTKREDGDEVTIFRMPTTVRTEQLRRECNTRDQGHQGNYFTDSPKLATPCWQWREGCRQCKSLSETRREGRGKGEKHQLKRA